MRKLLVDNPAAFTPSPYGLLSVIDFPDNPNVHWQNGIIYQTHCMNVGATTFHPCTAVSGAGEPTDPKVDTTELTVRGATPFTVYTRFDCSTVGMDQAREIAERALAQTEGYQVEYAFWTGEVDGQPDLAYPHLAADAEVPDPEDAAVLLQSVPVTGAAADPACALGFLEEVLGDCYNGVGVIHMPRKALATFRAWKLVHEDAGRLYTCNGHRVAVGSGYPGTSPGGSEPAQCDTWLYATGAMFGYRGPVAMNNNTQSLDRAKNTIEMIAERTYLIGWDCCIAGVQAELGVPGPVE